MVAVRRPVLAHAFYTRAHGNDGVEKSAELGDDSFELADMGLREVALVGRRFDDLDRQRRHDHPAAAERLFVDGQHLAAVLLDLPAQRRDLFGVWSGLQFGGGQAG